MVIKLQEGFDALTVEGDTLVVQAGCLMSRLAKQACEHSLAGLEFAGGIPGTVGGGLYMNAGAYGGELKDHVISCQTVAYDENQGEYYAKTYTAGQMGLGYRSSVFQSNGEIITEVTFRLPAGDREESLKKIEELNARRRASQPLTLPSAGSAFKRPKEGYAAQMIDEAGLKGFSVGGAQVSEKHSGFIVNTGNATAQDVLDLMAAVIKKVEETHGVTLEPEIRTVDALGLQRERR
jgi:UDP-N-acetylmuramate dehydrogenase